MRSSALAAVAMLWMCGPAPAQSTATLERRGEQLLAQYCAMCHAIGRTGNSPHPQAPPFRTLDRKYPVAALEEALGEGLISGHPDMPEFTFSAEDVGAIIAYLSAIQER